MGMSASQARLLTLTARMSDLEYSAQQISNSKLRLAVQSEGVSRKYSDALNEQKLSVLTGYNNSTSTYSDLSYPLLCGPDSPLMNQYGLSTTGGKILVAKTVADAFKSSADMNDFLVKMGEAKESFTSGYTKADYTTALAAVAVSQPAYTNATAATAAALKALDSYGEEHVKGYDAAGAWSYTSTATSTQSTIGKYKISTQTATAIKDSYGAALSSFQGTGDATDAQLKALSDAYKAAYVELNATNSAEYPTGTATTPYSTALSQLKELSDAIDNQATNSLSDGDLLDGDYHNAGSRVSINSADLIAELFPAGSTSSTTTTNPNGLSAATLADVSSANADMTASLSSDLTAARTSISDWSLPTAGVQSTYPDGSLMYNYDSLTGDKIPAWDVPPSTPAQFYEDKGYTVADALSKAYNELKIKQNPTASDIAMTAKLANIVNAVNDAKITNGSVVPAADTNVADWESTFIFAGSTNGLGTINGKSYSIDATNCAITLLKQLTAPTSVTSTSPGATVSTATTTKTNVFNSKDNAAQIQYMVPTSEVAKGITEADVKAKYDGLKSAYDTAVQTEATAKTTYEADAKALEYATPTYDITGSHSSYYTNLFNRMCDGYATVADEDKTMNNTDWLQNQIMNCNLRLEKVNSNSEWEKVSYKSDTTIQQASDDRDMAKAEAEYSLATAEIQTKDKRFDLDLKNIETEHTAVQTEVDSVKKVIDKNIDRSFKMFNA